VPRVAVVIVTCRGPSSSATSRARAPAGQAATSRSRSPRATPRCGSGSIRRPARFRSGSSGPETRSVRAPAWAAPAARGEPHPDHSLHPGRRVAGHRADVLVLARPRGAGADRGRGPVWKEGRRDAVLAGVDHGVVRSPGGVRADLVGAGRGSPVRHPEDDHAGRNRRAPREREHQLAEAPGRDHDCRLRGDSAGLASCAAAEPRGPRPARPPPRTRRRARVPKPAGPTRISARLRIHRCDRDAALTHRAARRSRTRLFRAPGDPVAATIRLDGARWTWWPDRWSGGSPRLPPAPPRGAC
jgi:hypothetical protein